MKTEVPLPTVANLDFVESLYAEYLRAPQSVPAEWQTYFAALDAGGDPATTQFRPGPSFPHRSIFNPAGTAAAPGATASDATEDHMMLLQNRVDRLVRAYRVRGHIAAKLDPLNPPPGTCPNWTPNITASAKRT